ncbi:MAG TPA: Crp/Fnr family transcriptional regulator [Burkholderiales bacterium]|jgi:CRP-like cAMP-binding protein
MSKLAQSLANAVWARGLTPEERARVERETFSRVYPKGTYVFRETDPVEHWIGIVDGLAKMSVASAEGQSTSFVAVGTGSWFGEGSLLRRAPRGYDGVVLRDSELAFMPRATFMALLDRNLSFNRFIIDQLNERLRQFVGLAQRDRLLEPNARVALSLGSLYNPLLSPGIDSALVISQEEIAELAGLSRQRTNEALKFLEQKGLVRVHRVGLTILDLEGLQNFK